MNQEPSRRAFLGATTALGAGALLAAACDAGPQGRRPGPQHTAFRAGEAVNPADFGGSPTDQLEAAVAQAGDGGVVSITDDYALDRTWVIEGARGVRIVGAGGRIVSELALGIDIVDSENVVLENLTVLGAGTPDNQAVRFRGANLWCAVSGCDVDGFSGGVRVEGNAQHEVYVERSRFTTEDIAGSTGIELVGAVDHAVIGNVVRGFERGVVITGGTSHRVIANHIYRFPSTVPAFEHCVVLSGTHGLMLSQNIFDNASVANVLADGCWGLSVTGNKFQSLADNVQAPLFRATGPGGHQMWNVAIVGNVFHQFGPDKKTAAFDYAEIDLAGSRNHIVRDNQFLNVRPATTSMTIYRTLGAGKTSKHVWFTNQWHELLGPVGACQVAVDGPEPGYLASVGSNKLQVATASASSSSRRLSVSIASRTEEIS